MTRHRPDRPQMIVNFIGAFRDQHGHSPSVRQIGEAVGLASPGAVHYHLRALREIGQIEWDGHLARTVRPYIASLSNADVERIAQRVAEILRTV